MNTRPTDTRRPWLLLLPVVLVGALAWLTWTLLQGPPSAQDPTDVEADQEVHDTDPPPVAGVAAAPLDADRQLQPQEPRDQTTQRLTLRGRLWDAAGRPVEGLITLQSADPLRALQESWRSQRSQDGWYRIPAVDPGVWRISVTPGSEHRRGQGTLDLTDGRTERRADFVLQEAVRIPVRVVDEDGTPLLQKAGDQAYDINRHLTILATQHDPGGDLPLLTRASASPLDAGRFASVSSFPPDRNADTLGTMTLFGDPPVVLLAAFKHRVLARQVVSNADPGTVTLIVPLEEALGGRSSVRFRLVSARTGLPPEQASADLSDLQSGRPRAPDEQGELHYQDILPGRLGLRIRATGHAPVWRTVDVEAGVDLDLGTITMEEDCLLQGQVLGGGVSDLEGATLVLADLDHLPAHETPITNHNQLVHDDGSFQIGAGRGRWALYLKNVPGHVANGVLVDARAGPVDGIDITARRGTPVRVELVTAAAGLRRLAWRMDDADGVPVLGSSRMAVLPGTYHLRVFDGTTQQFQREVEVGRTPLHLRVDAAEGTMTPLKGAQHEDWSGFLAVRLDEEAEAFDEAAPTNRVSLTGQVRGASGQALIDATVTLWVADGKQRRDRDAASHWFSFPATAPGDVTLEVTANGFRPFKEALVLAPQPAVQTFDVTLQHSRKTRVRVVTPDGEPFAKAAGGGVRTTGLELTVRPVDESTPTAGYSRQDARNRFAPSSWDVEVYGDLPVRFELFRENQDEPLLTKEFTELPPEVALVLDPEVLKIRRCDVRVLVVDGNTGEVLRPDSVRLMAPNAYGGGGNRELETMADGAVILREEPSGRRGLEVFLQGHDQVRRVVELDPGRQNDLGTVRLFAMARLTFRVIDEQGEPLDASLSLRPVGPEDVESTHHGLGADGIFDRPLGRRQWSALIRAEGHAPIRQTFDLSGGDLEAADVVLPVGTAVTVTGAWPLGERRGVQFQQASTSVWSVNVRGQESKTVHLLPGRYQVVLWQGSVIVHQRDVEVAGPTQTIRLTDQ